MAVAARAVGVLQAKYLAMGVVIPPVGQKGFVISRVRGSMVPTDVTSKGNLCPWQLMLSCASSFSRFRN